MALDVPKPGDQVSRAHLGDWNWDFNTLTGLGSGFCITIFRPGLHPYACFNLRLSPSFLDPISCTLSLPISLSILVCVCTSLSLVFLPPAVSLSKEGK